MTFELIMVMHYHFTNYILINCKVMAFELIMVMRYHFTNYILIMPYKDKIITYDTTVELTTKIGDSLLLTKVQQP